MTAIRAATAVSFPLSGVKRTCFLQLHMSAYDPKRTSVVTLDRNSHGYV